MNIVHVGYSSANYYVLGAHSPRLLIDAGWPGTLPRLLAHLRRQDIPLQEIRYLLATHYHPDHAGLAQELKEQGVRLIVLAPQVPAISALNAFMTKRLGRFEITLHDNLLLDSAESRAFLRGLAIGGEIISTPGHSDDSVTLVLDEGIAFTGDLHPIPSHERDRDDVAQSWSKIRSLNVRVIYPGHGPVRPLPWEAGSTIDVYPA